MQEAQLMLTNPRDAYRGQSRSPSIVPFHMLGIASSCAIVTLSFSDIRLKKCRDLEIRVRGHSRSFKVVPFDRFHNAYVLLVFYRNFVPKTKNEVCFEIFNFKTTVTLKSGLGVRQGHWKSHHAIRLIRLSIDFL